MGNVLRYILIVMSVAVTQNIMSGQAVRFKFPITVADNGTGRTTLWFGVHDGATYCLDADTLRGFVNDCGVAREFWLPPPPMSGIFDARFIDPRGFNDDCMDQGFEYNIHRFVDTTQIDTFDIQFQAGSGGLPFTFSWPSNVGFYCDSMRLKDIVTNGLLVNVNMLTQTSYTLTRTGITKLRMFVYGPTVRMQPPNPPVLSSPSNGAVNQPLSVTLQWQPSAGASSYRIQVSASETFSPLTYSDTAAHTSELVSGLEQQTTYYWRVNASNQAATSCYSQPFQFRTIILPPMVPTLVSPANGETNVPSMPILRWNRVPFASRYRVQLSRESNFTSIVKDTSVSDTAVQVSQLTNCVIHYWRVRAENDAGVSAFSEVRSFTVAFVIPAVPILVSPANNDTGVSVRPSLMWRRGDACVESYKLQASTDSAFPTGSRIVDTTLADTIYQFRFSLTGEMKYYWRVGASNRVGTSEYAVRSFTTSAIAIPEVPSLIVPSDNSEGVSLTPTLRWRQGTLVVAYHLQVARDSLFNILVENDSLITDTAKAIGPLLSCTKYYWRVRAQNQAGASDFSAAYRFSTIVFPPQAPQLIRPANGEFPTSREPVVEWSVVECVSSYWLQVARDSLFASIVFADSIVGATSLQLPLLGEGTIYYWRVRGKNSAGFGSYSAVRRFKTTYSGSANWLIPLAVRESGAARDTVYFGVHPQASYGIDNDLGEYELPPRNPGIFDVRFIDSPNRDGLLGEGVRVNLLPFQNYVQVDTYKVTFQPGIGTYPFEISWPLSFIRTICDSMLIRDEFGGNIVRARMDVASSVTVANSSISSLLIIKWGSFPIATDVKIVEREVPKGYTLYQNYPNPFNPITTIDFASERQAFITINIYDILGREINTLVRGVYAAGRYSIVWDGSNFDGEVVPSGVYFVRMVACDAMKEFSSDNAFSTTRRMLFMK